MKPLQQVQVHPANSLLVVIDIQKEQNMRGFPTKEPNAHLSTREAIVPVVRRLIEQARETGVRVLHVQSVRSHLEPEFTVFEYNPILKIGTEAAEFFDEVAPLPREVVVRKWCHDPWYETDLERLMQGLYPEPTRWQVLVTGGAAIGCALFGAMGFAIRGYRTFMVLDGLYGGPTMAAEYFSRTRYPTFPNVLLTRSQHIEFSSEEAPAEPTLVSPR